MVAKARVLLWHAAGLLFGNRADFLLHRREYHRRRSLTERALRARIAGDPSLERPNVCPTCGSRPTSEDRTLTNPIGFRFVTCGHDGNVYMDPIPVDSCIAELNNDEAEAFHWKVNGSKPVATAQAGKDDLEALLQYAGPLAGRPRLLDIGCATGSFLLAAQPHFEVAGLEANDATAKAARGLGFEVLTGDIGTVAVERKFEVVTMLQVIEHLTDPAGVLAKLKSLLVPGGLVYLNTPNVDSASFRLLAERHTHISSGGHVSLFTKQGLERLAERCGYEVLAHEFCGGDDLLLSDLVSFRFAPDRFVHRVAGYSPRFFHAAALADSLSFGLAGRLLRPPGKPSYHRALLRSVAPTMGC